MVALFRAALLPGLLAAVTLGSAPAPGAIPAPDFHLRLTASCPVKDVALTAVPRELRLWFSQRPTLSLSRVTLTGPQGEVRLAAVTIDTVQNALVALVEGVMAPGRYTVAWRAASDDGHAIRGEFGFSLR